MSEIPKRPEVNNVSAGNLEQKRKGFLEAVRKKLVSMLQIHSQELEHKKPTTQQRRDAATVIAASKRLTLQKAEEKRRRKNEK